MDISSLHVHHSSTTYLITFFCVLWPFATLTFLPRRQTSTAPVLAMLLPVAAAVCGVWIGLANGMLGMALSGRGGVMAVSAGIAEAFAGLGFALFSAILIAVLALIRRPRPVMDGVTVAF